ncbi:MAG TPA: EVE domain-containing protein [Ignavibacteriales bacterium]|nr:EVE domain-containing protein [Ignavibacteriales bacterium]
MYWVFKSEPSVFSIDDLLNSSNQTTFWDGVRNYQARNFLRDNIKLDDLVLFYHSNAKEYTGIVGLCKVVKEGYPDPSQFNPQSKYYDPTSKIDNPTWYCVDIKFLEKFPKVLTLDEIKNNQILSNMKIAQKGNRLSITPVTKEEFEEIMKIIR